MSQQTVRDVAALSMIELFRLEVENQSTTLTEGLLALERDPAGPLGTAGIEALMRAAHSIKGAARLVGLDRAVKVAHAMEDCLMEAQEGIAGLPQRRIDVLLRGIDLLAHIASETLSDEPDRDTLDDEEVQAFLRDLSLSALELTVSQPQSTITEAQPSVFRETTETARDTRINGHRWDPAQPAKATEDKDRVLRVGAENLTRLLGLAAESVVASRRMNDYTAGISRLKQAHGDMARLLSRLRQSLSQVSLDEQIGAQMVEMQDREASLRDMLAMRLEELERFNRRFYNLSTRLYGEVLDCRMRPFADGVRGFPRMMREIGREIGKQVRLEIGGQTVPVDRDILERIEAPLGHLLRNAVDHGIESPNERRAAGKAECGIVQLEARHSAGMLIVSVEDDGQGIDIQALRAAVVNNGRATEEVAGQLSESELLEFVFLPGFTMREHVTEISGRGVGLDAVQTAAKGLGGTVQVSSRHGQGVRIQLRLPITLSVIRALLVEISGEPYAFPLSRIGAAIRVARETIESVEGRQHAAYGDERIGLVAASQVLGLSETPPSRDDLPVIVLGDESGRYGLVVDRFLGERELVVRPLDPRLGKIQNVSAAALMPDQSPALILDMDDLTRSIEKLASGGQMARVRDETAVGAAVKRKRVLIVDDSLTVRELERKLIESRGYEAEVAVDGMNGWNAVRTGNFDLILTDIDMPRMDGIELVTLIRKDPRLRTLPVMIVSYKDREEDRLRGMEAGADYYLTKGSFHDETLLRAVTDLIGGADE